MSTTTNLSDGGVPKSVGNKGDVELVPTSERYAIKELEIRAIAETKGESSPEESYSKAIKELEDRLELWRQSSGMHSVLADFEAKKDKSLESNDIILASVNGIDDATEQAVAGVQESAVVAALLISFSIPLVVDPPDAIVDSEYVWQKWLHIYGWGFMSAIGAALILYEKIYSSAVTRTVRSSDRLRINLAGNAFNDISTMMYSLFFFFAVGMFADLTAQFGLIHGSIMSGFTGLILLVGARGSWKYIDAGHISYGWRANRVKRDDPNDDYLAFEVLRMKMEYAEMLKEKAQSVFKWDKLEKRTNAQGFSKAGQDLLFNKRPISFPPPAKCPPPG